jgi:2-C-methyl-D-erythritol 4-phosphate cytidylyltransferase
VTVAVLVPAAGSGTRLGPGAPKALRDLAGEPLLVHAVRGLRAAPSVGLVVVAAPPDAVEEVAALLASYDVEVVAGGAERQDSVALALAVLPESVDVVLVHDAARCLTPPEVVERVVAAVRAGAPAVVPVLPIADTVKEVAHGRILRTLDRGRLVAVQTPQGFAREVLEEAHRGATGEPATDDAGLVEVLGRSVATVAGDELAFKITRPVDLLLAEAVLRERG